ncbi:Uncharacterised protein [Edwardsiella tarda]|nr:Uncharacterised protein [Edwardsiella tarda]
MPERRERRPIGLRSIVVSRLEGADAWLVKSYSVYFRFNICPPSRVSGSQLMVPLLVVGRTNIKSNGMVI